MDAGHERSLSSRGAASSPYFSDTSFFSPVPLRTTKSSCFFLIVPSQKKERFPQLRVWFLLVRVFASVARERERERETFIPFFFVRAFGTTVFHRFWSGARAGRERERKRKRKISARPFNLNFLQIKQPEPSPFSDRIYRETKDHEKKKKKKKKRERER